MGGAFRSGVRLQLALIRRRPDDWLTVAVTPLMSVLFLAIVRNAGRDDLVGAAVLAPALFGMVMLSLNVTGETVTLDRAGGLLEPAIAAPAPLMWSLAGRTTAVTGLTALGFVQSWLVAWACFRIAVPIGQPAVFGLALLATLFAMAAAGLLMASVFVLTRSAQVLQLSLAFPLHVLGGVLVPVADLPPWVQPVARLVFLSWSSDLLRDSLETDHVRHVPARLAIVIGLGVAMSLLAGRALGRIVNRLRVEGTVGRS